MEGGGFGASGGRFLALARVFWPAGVGFGAVDDFFAESLCWSSTAVEGACALTDVLGFGGGRVEARGRGEDGEG